MGQLIPFSFENHTVRVISDDKGDPWFVAADLCKTIGLSDHKGSFRHHLDKVDDDERMTVPRSLVMGTPTSNMGVVARAFIEAAGGATWAEPDIWVVSESGAYALILRSRDATTPGTVQHRFRKWITSEVLPSIRRTGGYSQPQQATELARVVEAAGAFDPLMKVALAIGCDQNTAAISANQAIIKLTHVNLLETIDKTHLVAPNQEAVYLTPTEIGKEIGLSNQKVNSKLAQLGLQVKIGSHWQATPAGREFSRTLDTGKRHNDGTPVQQVKWASSVIDLVKTPHAA